MFTIEAMNPTHLELDNQITLYADILQYCTRRHMT